MWTTKSLLVAIACLATGALLPSAFSAGVDAQEQQATEAQAWEIYHGPYNTAAGAQDDTRFYVIRHNRLTGETQYIGCEDRDGCTQLAVEVQES